MKPFTLFSLIGLAILFIPRLSEAQNFGKLQPLETPVSLSQPISQVVVDPRDKDRILFHTGDRVYSSGDFAATWELLFEDHGIDEKIVNIVVDKQHGPAFFVITTRRIYAIDVEGTPARVIFEKKGVCPSDITVDPFTAGLYLVSTTKGCFISSDAGEVWEYVSGFSLDDCILEVQFHPSAFHTAYAVSKERIYKIDIDKNNARDVMIFSDRNDEAAVLVPEQEGTEDPLGRFKAHFAFSLNNDLLMYLMTEGKLYKSKDGGEAWEKFPLPSSVRSTEDDIRILSSNDGLIFSHNGVLWLYREHLRPTLRPLVSFPRAITRSFDLFEGHVDTVVLGYDHSLSYYDLPIDSNINDIALSVPRYNEVMQKNFQDLPGFRGDLPPVRELQEAAIRYALVSTGKMKSWEWRARLRSMIPQVSIGVEKEVTNNIDIDRGSTTDPDVFLSGPEERGTNLGLNMEWDLADLIWNDTETSIEIRERALVDQRDEILREVTRLYFEYKRLLREREVFVELDQHVAIANDVRGEEICAQLDALTGGYVSKARTA